MSILKKGLATSVVALGLAGFSQLAAAQAGTLAGTDISNTATVNYEVNNVPQVEVESSPQGNNTPGAGNGIATVFDVDRLLDLEVTSVDIVPVPSGFTAAGGAIADLAPYALTYTVDNLGNDTQDFLLTAQEKATGTTDNIDNAGASEDADAFDTTADYRYFVDTNNDGVLSAGDEELDAANPYIDELAAGDQETVFVVASIPAGQDAGDFAYVNLAATVADGGTADAAGAAVVNSATDTERDEADAADNGVTAGTPGDGVSADDIYVDNVLADDADLDGEGNPEFDAAGADDVAENGQDSDTAAYTILGTVINVQKTSDVIEDPFNGTTNPKRIPGATIEYTILVQNEGLTTAEAVVVSDIIPANTTYVADSVTINGTATPDADANVTPPDPAGTNTLTVNVPDLTADDAAAGTGTDQAVVTFLVTID